MHQFMERSYNHTIDSYEKYLLVGDIGGTNSNFGVLQIINKTAVLILSLHTQSQEINSFSMVIHDLLTYLKSQYNLNFSSLCLGAAGVISASHDRVKPTNLNFIIDIHDIIQTTGLKNVVLINDFEAVGYGIDEIDKKSLVIINKGTPRNLGVKGIIGAGTGLGKSFFVWSTGEQRYLLLPSEGGHADFAAQDQLDVDLIRFIRQSKQQSLNSDAISFEKVLSGEGIKHIYSFLATNKSYEPTSATQVIKQNGLHPDIIFKFWQDDPRCHDTFVWYAKLYARVAKNFSLDTLALGGIYIAGGIASKNESLFKLDVFMQEFTNCPKQKYLLSQIPITLITDYNVSLFGAARYLLLKTPGLF